MTFEEWMKYNNYSLKGMDEHEAEFLMREAWDCQQKRIELLEKRVIDLQGHDNLSYIEQQMRSLCYATAAVNQLLENTEG